MGPVFSGLSMRQFSKLVDLVASQGGQPTGTGRRWGFTLADRVLLVTVYCCSVLTRTDSRLPIRLYGTKICSPIQQR